MRFLTLFLCALWLAAFGRGEEVSADLLVVGGNESGVAAAVQAARLGVKNVVLVNDIDWLGGQFSAEAVGAPDEWTFYHGKKVNFPRSGMFLEIINAIRAHNKRTYGISAPGNSFCSSETIEPAAAARIFEEFVATAKDRVRVLRRWEVSRVQMEGFRVAAVEFRRPGDPGQKLTVRARLTIDASDWGDVIRLSGARYGAGPDLKSRFEESSAPVELLDGEKNEMNPISYCLVLRETDHDAPIQPPDDYDPRKYAALDHTRHWVDTPIPSPIYSGANLSIYTHRRLIDRRHNHLAAGTEKVLLNWPAQDYPLYDFPKRVADALETTETGASLKNIVNMTPAQHRIVFEDAKRQALGMLFHLQQTSKATEDQPSFRRMELSEEFGTPDRLPPKPYVREGLRLEALSMLREQDIRTPKDDPHWAKVMPADGLFGFQFSIDFHPTRRRFLDAQNTGPWVNTQTPSRNWSTHTDRAMFPLRGLVPVEKDGLLGASKNIGVSSIVSSALRLHGQMMLCGQASATVAWLALRDGVEPRAIAADSKRVQTVQRALARSGVLIWPFQDLDPTADYFEAVNLLHVRRILVAEPNSLDFQPEKEVGEKDIAAVLARAGLRELPDRNTGEPRTLADLAKAVWAALPDGAHANQ